MTSLLDVIRFNQWCYWLHYLMLLILFFRYGVKPEWTCYVSVLSRLLFKACILIHFDLWLVFNSLGPVSNYNCFYRTHGVHTYRFLRSGVIKVCRRIWWYVTSVVQVSFVSVPLLFLCGFEHFCEIGCLLINIYTA